jgi:hypothetical protein
MVFELQNLDRLYDPVVLNRLLDSEVKVSSPSDALTVGLLFNEIQDSVWAELRRSLQRRPLARAGGHRFAHRFGAGRRANDGSREPNRAAHPDPRRCQHLNESLARIDDTLKANRQRGAF